MVLHSLLFEHADDPRRVAPSDMPAYFVDLNLDQVVDAIAKPNPEYELRSIWYRPLATVDEVVYRQEIFRDIERLGLFEVLRVFSEKMRATRRGLASLDKIYSTYHRKGWFLEAACAYCDAVREIMEHLGGVEPESRGLKALKSYLLQYAAREAFTSIAAEASGLKDDLGGIHYCVTLKDLTVKVRMYDSEIDYGTDIEQTFERFSQKEAGSYRSKYPDSAGIDHVQGQILDCVAKLYPAIFARLDAFCASHASFIDDTVDAFEHEVQFYLSWLEYSAPLRRSGLEFCLPVLSATDKAISANGMFDLALAKKAAMAASSIVTNDISIHGKERILVVTGPNQGGKTTFARVFGQLHHLASIGCLVPAQEARLFLFDRMFTHFEREETLKSHHGKLHEELLHIHESLGAATTRSILILNEAFTSTTLKDSLFLSRRIIDKIASLDLLCVCVTFLEELASGNEKVVSLVGRVDSRDPSIRTFKIERLPADGLAYARSLAEKYHLTYERLKERVGS